MKSFKKLTNYRENNNLIIYIHRKVKSIEDKVECYETLMKTPKVTALKYMIEYGIDIKQ